MEALQKNRKGKCLNTEQLGELIQDVYGTRNKMVTRLANNHPKSLYLQSQFKPQGLKLRRDLLNQASNTSLASLNQDLAQRRKDHSAETADFVSNPMTQVYNVPRIKAPRLHFKLKRPVL